MKFEMPKTVVLTATKRNNSMGPSGCSTSWGACCYGHC